MPEVVREKPPWPCQGSGSHHSWGVRRWSEYEGVVRGRNWSALWAGLIDDVTGSVYPADIKAFQLLHKAFDLLCPLLVWCEQHSWAVYTQWAHWAPLWRLPFCLSQHRLARGQALAHPSNHHGDRPQRMPVADNWWAGKRNPQPQQRPSGWNTSPLTLSPLPPVPSAWQLGGAATDSGHWLVGGAVARHTAGRRCLGDSSRWCGLAVLGPLCDGEGVGGRGRVEHIADGVAHLPQPKCHLSNLPDVGSLVRVRLQHVAWGEGGREEQRKKSMHM